MAAAEKREVRNSMVYSRVIQKTMNTEAISAAMKVLIIFHLK